MPAEQPAACAQSFRCLEGLRGYMAWCVVIAHAGGGTDTIRYLPSLLWPFLRGNRAVNEFIILSGFVITHLILSKAEPYQAYITRRAFRIIPIYLVCVLIAIALPVWKFALASALGTAPPAASVATAASVADNFWLHAGLHGLLLHGAVPDTLLPFSSVAFLAPAWSLSLEWQFYVVVPLLIWLLRKSVVALLTTTVVLLAAGFVSASGHLGDWQLPSMLFLSIHFFLVGIFSRLWLDNLARRGLWVGPGLWILAAIVLPPLRWELLIWAFFYAAVVSERLPPTVVSRPLRWITANPLVTALGRVSYSTYLIHVPVFSAVVSLGLACGLSGRPATIALVAVAIALTVPVSFLLYRYVEQPFIRLGKRFSTPAIPKVAAAEAA